VFLPHIEFYGPELTPVHFVTPLEATVVSVDGLTQVLDAASRWTHLFGSQFCTEAKW
jgi:hypothetical protein